MTANKISSGWWTHGSYNQRRDNDKHSCGSLVVGHDWMRWGFTNEFCYHRRVSLSPHVCTQPSATVDEPVFYNNWDPSKEPFSPMSCPFCRSARQSPLFPRLDRLTSDRYSSNRVCPVTRIGSTVESVWGYSWTVYGFIPRVGKYGGVSCPTLSLGRP